MRLSRRRQLLRVLVALGLISVLAIPACRPDRSGRRSSYCASGPIQDLNSINPYLTEYFIGYEIFGLNYDLLVGFGPNMEPVPGFAEVVDPGRHHVDVQDPVRT